MKVNQNTERETVAMLVLVQNLGVRRIIPTSDNITGRGSDANNKTDLQVQNVVDKNQLQDTKVSTELIFIIN